ncbi:MAG: response regulator [Desulfuromonadales bacterium]|nr:response regulator [Desulfuromonadales bacterium]
MNAATNNIQPDMQNEPSSKSILIVEDESIIAMEIESRLQKLGYRVLAIAQDGEEAIAKVDELKPDLVLMDIYLKGPMDGVEATEAIRKKHELPIIYLTANTDEQTFQRAKVTEPFGYLLKPFEERELHTTIEIALYKAKTERELSKYRRELEDSLKERDTLIDKLQDALSKVKTLSGLVPICAACKSVRDDKGYWEQIESFIRNHSEAEFTHLVCPTCAKKLYPEIDLYPDEDK